MMVRSMALAAACLGLVSSALALETAPQNLTWNLTDFIEVDGFVAPNAAFTLPVTSFSGLGLTPPPGMSTLVLTGVKITVKQEVYSSAILAVRSNSAGVTITEADSILGISLTPDYSLSPALDVEMIAAKPLNDFVAAGVTKTYNFGPTDFVVASGSSMVFLTDAASLGAGGFGGADPVQITLALDGLPDANVQGSRYSIDGTAAGTLTAEVVYQYAAVPEAGTMLLGTCALMPILGYRRRSKKA